jgi:hypothetical protein
MEAADQAVREVEVSVKTQGGFKSPIRTLVRFFRKSQQRWRKKAIERRAKIKSLEHKVRDIDTSRAGWKSKALQLEADKQRLEEQLRAMEAERAHGQAQAEQDESKKA